MWPFFRKKKETAPVPDWAAAFTPAEFQAFHDAIDGYFVRKNIRYTLEAGEVRTDESTFGFPSLGLLNLMQSCKQAKTARYPKLVSEHFDALARAHQSERRFLKIVQDYDRVREYLGVRLYPDDTVRQIGEQHFLGRSFAGDVYATLVFDLPDIVRNVQPAQAEKWGIPEAELFETGVRNIRQKYRFTISTQAIGKEQIRFVQSDHFFAPNIMFDLPERPDLQGPGGALIGMPHRHAVLIYPISEVAALTRFLQPFIHVVKGMYEEGPGSVSAQLFWYYEGRFEQLPFANTGAELQFAPPAAFVNMLQKLTE